MTQATHTLAHAHAHTPQIAVSMVDNPPAKKYIVAVDQATSTLVEVAQALSTAMGPGPVEVLEGAAAEERLLTDASVTALQLDLQFDTEEATVAGFDFEWTAQAGFVENAAAVAAEFVAERNLRPVIGPTTPQVALCLHVRSRVPCLLHFRSR